MPWELIPQEIKEKGVVVGYEDCHHVKCRPFEAADGSTQFAKFRNDRGIEYPVLKVLVCFNGGPQHMLTWSNYSLQPLTDTSPGKFIYTQPSKMDYPTYKVRGREYKDTLSAKVEVPGDKTEYQSHKLFEAWLVKKMGQALADRIMVAFAAKMVEVMSPPSKAA